MLKYHKMKMSRLLVTVMASAICLPLAGCLNADDPWGEGSMAYTADEMYPIAAHKKCGQDWPDLGNDESNHFAPNHGCAVHANIAAMVADKSVLKKPKRRPVTTAATTSTTAIKNLETNANLSTITSNGRGGSTP
jgi:Pilus biogenesis CpaD protein (pilus_cpaD)